MSTDNQKPLLSGSKQGRKRNKTSFVKDDPRINRAGRPRGCTDKTKLLIKKVTEEAVQDALNNMIIAIKAGDVKVSQTLIEWFSPTKILQQTSLDIPQINTIDDLLEANTIVNEALFSGEIAPSDIGEYGKRIEDTRKLFETAEAASLMDIIEERLGK
jgi:hypothetical protein